VVRHARNLSRTGPTPTPANLHTALAAAFSLIPPPPLPFPSYPFTPTPDPGDATGVSCIKLTLSEPGRTSRLCSDAHESRVDALPGMLSTIPSRVSAQAVPTAPQTNSSFAIHVVAHTNSSITVLSHSLPPNLPQASLPTATSTDANLSTRHLSGCLCRDERYTNYRARWSFFCQGHVRVISRSSGDRTLFQLPGSLHPVLQ
jgi:hypothetical protein